MRILADENVDRPIVEELRNKGFEVKYILEISPGTENGDTCFRSCIIASKRSEVRVFSENFFDFLKALHHEAFFRAFSSSLAHTGHRNQKTFEWARQTEGRSFARARSSRERKALSIMTGMGLPIWARS